LGFAVSFVNAPTLRTSARSVPWIDKFDRDTGSFCLVEDKAFQLVKRPAMQTAALLFSSPCPDSDAFEILKSDSSSGALCNTYYLFRNYVIRVGREALLFAFAPAQQTLGGFSALFLKLAPQSNIAGSFALYRSPRKAFPVAGVGNRHQAKINSDPLSNLVFFLVWNVHRSEKKPFLITVNQVGFAAKELKQFSVMVAADKRDFLPPLKCPDIHDPRLQVPTQDARIITDRAVVPEYAFGFSVKLVGISNLGVETHDDLRRKRELVADSPVKKFVQRVLAKLSRLPGQIAQAIARGIGCLKGAQQGKSLFGRRLQLDLSGKFQALKYRSSIEVCNLAQRN
jgi:hypothetical protein